MGLEVTDLPMAPVAEDGTFALGDALPNRVGDVHHVLGYAGDKVHYGSEHWLVVGTVKVSRRATKSRP
jgi:hypothetical protein